MKAEAGRVFEVRQHASDPSVLILGVRLAPPEPNSSLLWWWRIINPWAGPPPAAECGERWM